MRILSKLSTKYKAGALSYAISIVLLLSLISSSFIFIHLSSRKMTTLSLVKEHLTINNLLAFQIGINHNKNFIISSTGDTTELKKTRWGLFHVLNVKTYSNGQYVEKSALISNMYKMPNDVLYLNDFRQAIRISGKTSIQGNITIPEKGLERGTIFGKDLEQIDYHQGNVKTSTGHIPKLNQEYEQIDITKDLDFVLEENIPTNDSIFPFHQKTTLVIKHQPIKIDLNLSGNIIIKSFDSIFISKKSSLKNIILVAPIVHFEKGFRGNVQVFASKRITCEDSVHLLYPSILVLNEENENDEINQNHQVNLGINTKILGGVLLSMNTPHYRNPVSLKMNESIVYGFIYNQGNSQLKGKIYGAIFSNMVFVKDQFSIIYNGLLDTQIIGKDLPINDLCINWLENREYTKTKILTLL